MKLMHISDLHIGKKLFETMSLKALFDAEDSMEVGRTLVYKFEQIQSGLFFHNL